MNRSVSLLNRTAFAILLIAAGLTTAPAVAASTATGEPFDMVLLPATPGEAGQRLAVSWRGHQAVRLELRAVDVFGEPYSLDPMHIEPGMHLLPLDAGVFADHVIGVVVDAGGRPLSGPRTAGPPMLQGNQPPASAVLEDQQKTNFMADRDDPIPARLAQVIDWKPTFTQNGAPTGMVLAATIHDDGTGPGLVIGGTFGIAGGQRVNRIARWNGASWSPLGSGIEGASQARVLALHVHEGDLIAAGFFSSAGGVSVSNIARWNGSEWTALGDGFNDWVRTLATHEGQLIAAGHFTASGSQTVGRVARWTGTQWSAMADGFDDFVVALGIHDGELLAGGRFATSGTTQVNRIARWTGTQWAALGTGLGGTARALLSHGGDLVVGGTTLGGQWGIHPVMRWDGVAWTPLGSPMSKEVIGLAIHDGMVTANGVREMYRWNGSQWVTIGSRVSGVVYAMEVLGSALIVGGEFSSIEGVDALVTASFSGGRWSAFGTPIAYNSMAMTVYSGTLVRSAVTALDQWSPEPWASGLFRWVEGRWEPFASGLDGHVWALAEHQGDLIAAGQFSRAGSTAALNIARWDGADWHPLGPGLNGTVWSLASHDGELVAGGSFGADGSGASVVGVARWNGVQWRPMGPSPNWWVRSLVRHDGQLIAGAGLGFGPMIRGRVARWDGSAWIPVGPDLDREVRAVAAHNGQFFATGGESGLSAPLAYRLEGDEWIVIGPNLTGPGNAILSFGDSLYVGGRSGLHRWDGNTWHSPYGVISVERLYALNGDLVVLGNLTGFPTIPSTDAVALGPSQISAIAVQSTSPPLEREWVTIRAELSATTAPTRGHVTIVGSPGGSCTDLTLEPIDATRSVAECAIRWNRPGAKRVRARYVGGSDNVVTWQPSTSADFQLTVIRERLLQDGFELVPAPAPTVAAPP